MLTIRGHKVALRDFRRSDLEDYRHWWSAQEWQRWDAPWETFSEAEAEQWLERLRTGATGDPPTPRVRMEVERLEDGRHVGWVTRYWVDRATDWLEVGVNLPEAGIWGQGIGTEALGLWVDYLFRQTDLERVGFGTWSGNLPMIRVGEKLGFRPEACIRKARKVDGRYYDAVRYGILREEWEKARRSWPAPGSR